MYGFQFDGLDPNSSIAKKAIKRVLGTHLHEISPKIGWWVAHGVELQMKAATVNWGDGMSLELDPFRGRYGSH